MTSSGRKLRTKFRHSTSWLLLCIIPAPPDLCLFCMLPQLSGHYVCLSWFQGLLHTVKYRRCVSTVYCLNWGLLHVWAVLLLLLWQLHQVANCFIWEVLTTKTHQWVTQIALIPWRFRGIVLNGNVYLWMSSVMFFQAWNWEWGTFSFSFTRGHLPGSHWETLASSGFSGLFIRWET